ncbi:macro domain-containing protein [Streptomyces longwoodensis]|uniref:macro domain-containing protein n=1 Tax=Streptomyces longwoodensis TaxID=68231 RepID=UPI0036F82168
MLRNLARRRSLTIAATNSSVAFAAISGLVQLTLSVYPLQALKGGPTLASIITLSAAWGVLRALPRKSIARDFTHPPFKITVKQGDLFDEDSHLVIGFTDTFDTDTNDPEIISPGSLQAQFLRTRYSGDTAALDRDIAHALTGLDIYYMESRECKPKGKLARYPVGTVAVLGSPSARYYCVAYSRMERNLIAQSSVDSLWLSLSHLWDAISETGHRERVSIPIIGSDLARIDNLEYESIAKMLILSFAARSRRSVVSKELTLIVHPRDSARINMNEVAAFLNSL